MSGFDDFDVEIENSKESDPYTEIVTIATAGTPVTVTPSNGRVIRAFSLFPPKIGPNSGTNTFNRYILYSTDGGTTYKTLPVNEWVYEPGNITDIRIDASNDGMKCEVEIRS